MAEQQIKRVSLHRPQLMADLDVEYWVNLPRDTLEHLMTDRFPRRERIWACIILHSYGHEYLSPFCQRIVNGRRQEMRKVDIARELDIDKAGVSREFARFETDGLVRTEGKRIYPCPKPVPRSRGRKVVRTDNFLDGNVSLRAEYELELAKLEKLCKAERLRRM